MTDTWTLFTSGLVLNYLTSIVSCTLLWRCMWCIDNIVVYCVNVQHFYSFDAVIILE